MKRQISVLLFLLFIGGVWSACEEKVRTPRVAPAGWVFEVWRGSDSTPIHRVCGITIFQEVAWGASPCQWIRRPGDFGSAFSTCDPAVRIVQTPDPCDLSR